MDEWHLWDLRTGRPTQPLLGHLSGITAVAFSPDGKTLASAALDLQLKLWNIATLQQLASIPIHDGYPTLRFSPDGGTLAIGNMAPLHPQIQIVQAPSFQQIAEIEARLPGVSHVSGQARDRAPGPPRGL